jgi:hypothetical protein
LSAITTRLMVLMSVCTDEDRQEARDLIFALELEKARLEKQLEEYDVVRRSATD